MRQRGIGRNRSGLAINHLAKLRLASSFSKALVTEMPRSKNSSSRPGRPERVTLQDIASAAGLHVMTVSNALNDARIVAPATRERVKRIARELNYIPNPVARALVTGRTGIVAIMSGPINEPYFAEMVHELEKQLNADGYRLLLTPYEIEDLFGATREKAVDGAIAIDRYDLIEQFQVHSPLPCVSIGTVEHSYIDSVIADLSAGVQAALKLMMDGGCQRIAYVVTTGHLARPSESRAQAYLRALERAGRTSEIINVDTNDLDLVTERLKTYIEENGCPDALLCQNDETAMSAYRVLRELDFRVPDDVMLVGCDGQLHMKYFETPLSTVAQPIQEMCAMAWTFLKNRMADASLPLQHATLPGELIVRESLRGMRSQR
jgi:DNA-binding LacI/PurR family transcriptional regulator